MDSEFFAGFTQPVMRRNDPVMDAENRLRGEINPNPPGAIRMRKTPEKWGVIRESV